MKRLWLLIGLMPACVTAEKDDRICLDFGSYTIVKEKCIPMYGAIICMDQEKTEVYCKLYEEKELVREKSD